MAHRSRRRSVAPSASRRRLASENSAKQPSDPMSRASSSVAPGRSEPSSPHSMPPAATPAAAAASAARKVLDLTRVGDAWEVRGRCVGDRLRMRIGLRVRVGSG